MSVDLLHGKPVPETPADYWTDYEEEIFKEEIGTHQSLVIVSIFAIGRINKDDEFNLEYFEFKTTPWKWVSEKKQYEFGISKGHDSLSDAYISLGIDDLPILVDKQEKAWAESKKIIGTWCAK